MTRAPDPAAEREGALAAAEAAQRAFQSAVAAEHEAIAAHERAAAMHAERADRLAVKWERADGRERHDLEGQRDTELERALGARQRAALARHRLLEEGALDEELVSQLLLARADDSDEPPEEQHPH